MPDEEIIKETPQMSDAEAKKLEKFKIELQEDADAMQDQREMAYNDMEFLYAPGGQWADFLTDEFADRVKLQLDITTNYKNRFIAEWNQNRIGVDYKPDEDSVSDDDAELLSGIRRADFRESGGKVATDNAVDEVGTCGYGCYKLATKFVNDGDPENDDQRVEFRTIPEAYNSVIWDSASKGIVKDDARRVVELVEFTVDAFEDEFPGFKPVSAYTPENVLYRLTSFDKPETVYIATRYEIKKKKVDIWVYRNLESGKMETYSEEEHELIKKELKDKELTEFVRKRRITKQMVMKTVFSGDSFLKSTIRVPGEWLPVIPVYGYRGYVNGQEWYKGLVRSLKDAQRLFNMQMSQLAENAASAGQEVPIFDPDQMIGPVADTWSDKNNKPYLLAKALRNKDGSIAVAGPLGYSKPAQLDGSTQALLQIVPQFIQQVTGGAPQDTLNPNTSGKAINALIKRENQDTQPIMDNIALAIEWEGKVYASIASEIYNTQRIMRTLGKDGVEGNKQLLQETIDEETGKIVQANTISGKRFLAHADIGPQYDTQREQLVEELKGMLEAMSGIPAAERYTPLVLSLILKSMTGPSSEILQEAVRKDMILAGHIQPETDEEKQMVAAAQQQANQPDPQQQLLQAAAMQAEGEGRERDSKVLDNIASAKKKQAEIMEIIAKLQLDAATADSNIRVNEAKAQSDINKQVLEGSQLVPLGGN